MNKHLVVWYVNRLLFPKVETVRKFKQSILRDMHVLGQEPIEQYKELKEKLKEKYLFLSWPSNRSFVFLMQVNCCSFSLDWFQFTVCYFIDLLFLLSTSLPFVPIIGITLLATSWRFHELMKILNRVSSNLCCIIGNLKDQTIGHQFAHYIYTDVHVIGWLEWDMKFATCIS